MFLNYLEQKCIWWTRIRYKLMGIFGQRKFVEKHYIIFFRQQFRIKGNNMNIFVLHKNIFKIFVKKILCRHLQRHLRSLGFFFSRSMSCFLLVLLDTQHVIAGLLSEATSASMWSGHAHKFPLHKQNSLPFHMKN